jgi:tetratricopeptide (TPR) repeat protein
MAPKRPVDKRTKKTRNAALAARRATAQASTVNPKSLLAEATFQLQQGDPKAAEKSARAAYKHIGEDCQRAGAALSLLAEIHVELGELEQARTYFHKAVEADHDGSLPEELGGGAEKFLWLAQLSEEGGQDSVSWFERGASALRNQMRALSELQAQTQSKAALAELEAKVAEKKHKLARALCAVAEVYMTDLSWEADAEQRCEALIMEATMLAPELAETWQTVANVRISQGRTDDAKAALERSLALWTGLEPEDPSVPAFPTRVSLARLLMEVDLEETAVDVVERLVAEDDQSVEAWYLGGYAFYTIGEKLRQAHGDSAESWKAPWKSARQWLAKCLQLFRTQEYEDERLGDHTKELLEVIQSEIGNASTDDGDEDDGWENSDNSDEGEEMA